MNRRIALGFVLALLLLGVLIRIVGGRAVAGEFSSADYRFLGLAFGSGLLALTFRALVWEQFLSLVDDTLPRIRILALFLSAMFIKYVTPYGQLATEPFVAYLVSQRGEMAFEDGLAGILSADLLNYVLYYTYGFVALGVIVVTGALGTDLSLQLLAFTGLFSVVVGVVFVTVRRPSVVYTLVLWVTTGVRRLLCRFSGRFEDRFTKQTVRSRLDGFYETIDTISADRMALVAAIVFAHLGMLFLMLPVYLGALALGYRLALPVVALAVAFGKLGAVVPAPGGTGGVETMVTGVLATLGGLELATALTIALIYRLSTYWLTVGVGGLSAAAVFLRGPHPEANDSRS
ncbi:lysylphosphatidylglycerol synthase transmembrane domain-containing protein [Natrialba chahannaoensis]|uniref:lysylphosphatidylglycerol synthase transmembrane domain-containing protein n=1 Tax=Natrialba chahannaoensis TaxID=68911 RepID=UPI000678081D|nr:lysylphosphatidylglycerol synthase transmembrane domain-containing protein [Natrialba chahannaoensis]